MIKIKNMMVSIITPCLNSEKTIRDTIKSVLCQTYKNIEYIIVDGASTDGTLKIINEYLPLFCGRMRYVSEPDRGIYNAMNKGILLSHGQLIGIINSDDFYAADAVESVIRNMSKAPYQVVYGYLQIFEKNKNKSVLKNHHNNLRNSMIPHPTCFVTRKVYQTYGLYLEWFKISADYELMLRLCEKDDVIFTQVKQVISYFRPGGKSSNGKYPWENDVAKMMHGMLSFDEFEKAVFNFCLKKYIH